MDRKSEPKTQSREQDSGEIKQETTDYYQINNQMGNTAAAGVDDTTRTEQELEGAGHEKNHWMRESTVRDAMNENTDERFSGENVNKEIGILGQGCMGGEVPSQNHQSIATQISKQEAYPTPTDNYVQQAPSYETAIRNESKAFVKQEPDINEISQFDKQDNISIDRHESPHLRASVIKELEKHYNANQESQNGNQRVEVRPEEVQDEWMIGIQHQDSFMQSNLGTGVEPHDPGVDVFRQHVDVEHEGRKAQVKVCQNLVINAPCERKPACFVAEDDHIFDELINTSNRKDVDFKHARENLKSNSRPTAHANLSHQMKEVIDYPSLDDDYNDDENENDNHNLARTDSVERFIKENTAVDTTKRNLRQRDYKPDDDGDEHEKLVTFGDRTYCSRSDLQLIKPKSSQLRPKNPNSSVGIENYVQAPVLSQYQIDMGSEFHQYGLSDQYMQQLANIHDPRGYDMGYGGSVRGQMQAQQDYLRHRQQNSIVAHQSDLGFQENFAYHRMDPFETYGSTEYHSNIRREHQDPTFGQHGIIFHHPHHPEEIYKQATQQLRSDGQNPSRRSLPLSATLHQLSRSSPVYRRSNMSKRGVEESEPNGEGQSTDKYEPLKSCVKRQPSVMSQGTSSCDNSVMGRRTRSPSAHVANQHKVQDESIESKPNPCKNPIAIHRPLPVPLQVLAPVDKSSSEGISWKLPQFEVQYQPPNNEEDLPSAKVSIPNLVREEIILSPDHADQELHLLLNLFLPGQQALATPDPAPAHAVLNFHTIALMVIEAYVQFEIGDELGFRSIHSLEARQHRREDEPYERVHDAKDADVDQIFFEVIDRWRAGMQSNKQTLKLIRGAQEFCDVALDIIYYIKVHGLLRPKQKARKQRSDKGVPKGPRKPKEEEVKMDGREKPTNVKGKGKKNASVNDEGRLNSGIKREREANANVLQTKKKRKLEEKKNLSTITVVKKR